MLRIDDRLLAGALAGVFLVGILLGFAAAGTGLVPTTALGGGPSGPDSGGTGGTPAPKSPTATPDESAVTTAGGSGGASATAATGTGTAVPTAAPTTTPTSVPTATPTSVSTATPLSPTATATQTPMLARRFDAAEIESELRRLLNDWRADQGLPRFALADGRLVADLNAMAAEHSAAMADIGKTVHRIDNRTSADRYREHDLYLNCWFKKRNNSYLVTPDDNDLEVLGMTYAGRTYDTGNGTDFNANETAVARDLLERWTGPRTFRQRIAYHNASRVGIGVEVTGDNEVYATGNLCGPKPDRD